jgi:hypothetical protein
MRIRASELIKVLEKHKDHYVELATREAGTKFFPFYGFCLLNSEDWKKQRVDGDGPTDTLVLIPDVFETLKQS